MSKYVKITDKKLNESTIFKLTNNYSVPRKVVTSFLGDDEVEGGAPAVEDVLNRWGEADFVFKFLKVDDEGALVVVDAALVVEALKAKGVDVGALKAKGVDVDAALKAKGVVAANFLSDSKTNKLLILILYDL